MVVASTAMFSTAALAEDYDNTALSIIATTDAYELSVKSPKTGATEFAASTTMGPVEVTGTWSRNGSVDDYTIGVGKEIAVPGTPLYAGADAEFNFGDSYTSDTRELVATPYVGVTTTVNSLSPFAEVGYSFKSTQSDILDLSRNASYVKLGAVYAISPSLGVSASVKEARDLDFKNPGDRNLDVALNIRF